MWQSTCLKIASYFIQSIKRSQKISWPVTLARRNQGTISYILHIVQWSDQAIRMILMCGWDTLISASKMKSASGMLPIWAKRTLAVQVLLVNEYFHFNDMHTGCLSTSTTLEHISTSLKRSKISLSSGICYLKEPLFVGRKGRKKSETDDCLVGNSCQDRKTSVSKGKTRRKPHNQDLFCGLWPGQIFHEQILTILKFKCILKV